MHVSAEQIRKGFDYAKKVYANEITKSEAADYLTTHYQLNRSTAKDFVYVFLQMMKGEKYTRALSGAATSYFLENISVDFGADKLEKALDALILHIGYYEDGHKTNMHKLRGIHKEFSGHLMKIV